MTGTQCTVSSHERSGDGVSPEEMRRGIITPAAARRAGSVRGRAGRL